VKKNQAREEERKPGETQLSLTKEDPIVASRHRFFVVFVRFFALNAFFNLFGRALALKTAQIA
jgi:hypothetical protein